MPAATAKRNSGAQPRGAALRLFAMIDRDLASIDGLSTSPFCRDHGCSLDTLTRYLLELVGKGKQLVQADGIWRYGKGESRIFTDDGTQLFTKD